MTVGPLLPLILLRIPALGMGTETWYVVSGRMRGGPLSGSAGAAGARKSLREGMGLACVQIFLNLPCPICP